jgi:hypothetical protein
MSFSIDLASLFSYAAQMFNSLSPIVVVVGGMVLGGAISLFVLRVVGGLLLLFTRDRH